MLHEVSARTLVPVTIATVAATYVGQIIFGPHPAFLIPAFEIPYSHVANPLVLLAYAGLGAVTGAVSALFIATLYRFESIFEKRVGGSYYRQHAIGMLLLGLMMYGMMVGFGHYYIEGVGYAAIQDVLSGARIGLFLLVLLFGLKLLATSVTLGSGASGGVFSPALFMGAMAGGAYGMFLHLLAPEFTVTPAAFAVVGMAGVVGGSTAAPVTAIVMIFEMTLDYRVIVPMTLTVAVSYGIRRALIRESIYTRKLMLRGHPVPEALQANVHLTLTAKSLMDTNFEMIAASETLGSFTARTAQEQGTNWFLVEENSRIVGILPKGAAETGNHGEAVAGDLARRDFCACSEEVPVGRLSIIMRTHHAGFALITRNGQTSRDEVKGVVTKDRIADALADAVAAFEEG
jgi:CIC family chloride channel protein